MKDTTDEQRRSFMAERTRNNQYALEHREKWARERGCENFAHATVIGLVRVSRGIDWTNPAQRLKSVVTHAASAERAAELCVMIDQRMRR